MNEFWKVLRDIFRGRVSLFGYLTWFCDAAVNRGIGYAADECVEDVS